MAVGAQGNTVGLNSQITQLALSLRGVCDEIRSFNEYVGTLGAAGLEALGFSTQDATTFVNDAAVLNTVSAVYYGTATQGSEFDFDNALSSLWAGQ